MTESWRREPWNDIPGSQLDGVTGTTWVYSTAVLSALAAPVDLTQGYSVRMILKKRPSVSAAELQVTTGDSRLTASSLGIVTVTLSPADTLALGAGKLWFEVFVTDPSAGVTRQDFGTIEFTL